MKKFEEISLAEGRNLNGGSLWDTYMDWIGEQLWPAEHDHDTCDQVPNPYGEGHLTFVGTIR